MHSSRGIFSLAVMLATLTATAAAPVESPKKVVVLLKPTKGHCAQGMVTFIETCEGMRVIANIDHLSPGQHGFQLHEYGDCSDPYGRSIGPIYNPQHSRHGSPYSVERTVGDLGNICANEVGHAHYDRVDPCLQMSGPFSIIGRSIAIFANRDDLTSQPNGNVGGCVACGVIAVD